LRPEAFLRALRYPAELIVSALRGKIAVKRWLRSVSRQTQQYWLRSLRRFCSSLNTRWTLSLDDLGRFCRSRFFPMIEQCAPLLL
jgi:DNA-directed RNA polymerase specialized sigma24 family protein